MTGNSGREKQVDTVKPQLGRLNVTQKNVDEACRGEGTNDEGNRKLKVRSGVQDVRES